MKLDDLTLGDLKSIKGLLRGRATSRKEYSPPPAVVVRAYSGVFYGYLLAKSGGTVELRDARQIWSWDSGGMPDKVNTAGDISLRGVGSGSKVSSPVAHMILEEVKATFFASSEASSSIEGQKWASK